jgi:hypothetical protein
MGRILMQPQHLATRTSSKPGSDAASPQAGPSDSKAYLFKPLSPILHSGHIPVTRAAQRGRDWPKGQTHSGDRSRSITWKNLSKHSQHSVFWPSWRRVTKAAPLKNTWHPSPRWPRLLSNPSLRVNITDTAGRVETPALTSRGIAR